MPRPKYPKPDANQQSIIDDLEACGFCVWDLSRLPKIPDILVGGWDANWKTYRWVLFEVKVAGGRLTKAQEGLFELWRELPMAIAYATEDVLRYFGRLDD